MVKIEKLIPVKFYKEESGKQPVHDWLMNLDKASRKIIGYDIKLVQFGWPIGMPLVRPLGNSLWEVRSDVNNRIARVIFTVENGAIVLLHGFIKKSQKTSPKDLELGKKRAKNLKYI